MREIVFDTETTGLDPYQGDRLVEIGCVELVNGFPTGVSFHYYLNPQRDVPEGAFKVHGLSAEFLKDKPLFAEICEEFLGFVGDAPLIAHNAMFDLGFINAELERCKKAALLPVQADRLARRDGTDDLSLVVLADFLEMRHRLIARQPAPVHRRVLPRDEAVAHFKKIGEHYKAEIIGAIPAGESISLYGQGDWEDLCRGPHVPSTGKLKAFKLMKVAGAYWRGDSRNEMLQRIYGTAWSDEKQLADYLKRLEEAEKRDHRRLGREQDLFHIQEEAPGAVFWHPKGWTLFQTLIAYMREEQGRAGYIEVNTPELMDARLWEQSGHLEKFGENMYLTKTP